MMMDRYISYIPDAFRYWRYHRRWLEQGKRFLLRTPQQVGKRANKRIHDTIRSNVREIPIIVEALVHEAPNEQALPLIGSELLEEAYRLHGVQAFRQFGHARLLPEHRQLILRGVWPSTLRRAWLALRDAPADEQLPIDTPVDLAPADFDAGAEPPIVPSPPRSRPAPTSHSTRQGPLEPLRD